MATVKIQIGDVLLAPTDGEKKWAALGAGVAAIGFLANSSALKAIGLVALAGAGLAVYEEAQTFVDPDLMNGNYQTDGALSATRGAGDAAALRRGAQ